VVGEEGIQLEALLEVFDGFEATDILEEVEVAVGVDAGADQSVPVDALQLDVRVVDLEVEIEGLGEVDVGTLDGVHVFARSFKLVELEVLGEHFHFNQLIIITMSQSTLAFITVTGRTITSTLEVLTADSFFLYDVACKDLWFRTNKDSVCPKWLTCYGESTTSGEGYCRNSIK
jgi:hypothetical protein